MSFEKKIGLFVLYSIALVGAVIYMTGRYKDAEIGDLRVQLADADSIMRQQDSLHESARRIEEAAALQAILHMLSDEAHQINELRVRSMEMQLRAIQVQQKIDGAVLRIRQSQEDRHPSNSYDVPLPPLNPRKEEPKKTEEFKVHNENVTLERDAAAEKQDADFKASIRMLKRIDLEIFILNFLVCYLF